MSRTDKKKRVMGIEKMIGFIFLLIGIVWLVLGIGLAVCGIRAQGGAQENAAWEMGVGEEVNIFRMLGLIFGGFGLTFTAIGGGIASLGLRREKRRRNLMAAGRRVYAEVTGGYLCRNYSVNNRHPYKIECRYKDVFTGQIYLYSSDYTWTVPELYIGQQIAVYVNESDMSQYYVDVDSLQAASPQIHDYR